MNVMKRTLIIYYTRKCSDRKLLVVARIQKFRDIRFRDRSHKT